MFVHAAATAFNAGRRGIRLRNVYFPKAALQQLFYERVVCRATWKRCTAVLGKMRVKCNYSVWQDPPPTVSVEPALDFVWQFGNIRIRELIERLAQRKLYKRVFELPLGQLDKPEYDATTNQLSGPSRLKKAKEIQNLLLDEVSNKMRSFETTTTSESASESHSKLKYLRKVQVPLIVLDFPTRISKVYNIPKELEDPVRKYSSISMNNNISGGNIVSTIWDLQRDIATVRVFAEPDLHELIIRYLQHDHIRKCVDSIIPSLLQIK